MLRFTVGCKGFRLPGPPSARADHRLGARVGTGPVRRPRGPHYLVPKSGRERSGNPPGLTRRPPVLNRPSVARRIWPVQGDSGSRASERCEEVPKQLVEALRLLQAGEMGRAGNHLCRLLAEEPGHVNRSLLEVGEVVLTDHHQRGNRYLA